ncbi:MAG: DUF4349 domain-containing protein, partial [Streptomyces sp.]|nr:DUF4349 domain-containing protein [Streptomyces sp.]
MRTPVSARRRSVRALAGFLLVTALALAGCSGADDSSSDGGGSAEKAVSDARGAAPQEGAAADSGTDEKARDSAPTRPTANRIIRTASLTVQVKDVPKALDAARTAAENAGGFIGSETTTRDEDSAEHTRVVLRVPTDAYQEVLTDLEGTGKLLERTSKAQDVTDQVVDVESRIRTQR